MDLRATTRYPSRGFSTHDAGEDGTTIVGPVSVDGLEVVDEQVVPLAPLDAPGRRLSRERPDALG